MATTTPNYGWPVPTSTDYVKDGATAIEALGDAIDATVFGLPSAGLTLVKTQTIGSAVSSVTVTGAFSATYDNYLVTISGGVASTTTGLNLTLGSTATGYYRGGNFTSYTGTTVSGINSSNASSWLSASLGTTTSIDGRFELYDPFLTKNTKIRATYVSTVTNGESYVFGGFLNDSTSYTAFTLTTTSGTLTGGTIRVYGYRNS